MDDLVGQDNQVLNGFLSHKNQNRDFIIYFKVIQ